MSKQDSRCYKRRQGCQEVNKKVGDIKLVLGVQKTIQRGDQKNEEELPSQEEEKGISGRPGCMHKSTGVKENVLLRKYE